LQAFNNQQLTKTPHNRVIYNQETTWLKKIDSQTTFCKLLLPLLNWRIWRFAGAAPAKRQSPQNPGSHWNPC
uniref:hypothetical protein n=1 Tax=Prevotella sp. TaxID=59823 RepID=UPI003FEFC1C0